MRLSKLFAAACLSLTLAACGGSELADESLQSDELSSVEQRVEPKPGCPVGDRLIYWTEYGTCGGCSVSRKPGTPVREYAACEGNISGTTAHIGNSCQSGCALEL
ncbi:hypothetical protein ACN28I_31350 [Archangium gephyra]|uniref:hypothetical protein n=1 Tax=Archangium gephyra TaxID=48 RepID=UPI003B7C4277